MVSKCWGQPPDAMPLPSPLIDLDPALDAATLRARLTVAEQARLEGFTAEKRRSDWLRGRAAAKEAVREARAHAGGPRPDWLAFEVGASPEGAPRVVFAAPAAAPLAVSLSHGHGRAIALALPPGPGGGLPGVDLERIRPRRLGTLRFYLHEDERAPVLALPGGADPRQDPEGPPGPRDVAAVVVWALKEAAFKALQPPRGTGLLDVGLTLEAPYDAAEGRAQVRYLGSAQERAALLGVSAVSAGWRREGDLVVAWTIAHDARLPE